jgi:mannose-1-phosphate guanylyltransferase
MEDIQKHLYVLILAGGGGTRLWPQSRDILPKQFMALFGGKSLFQLTLERAMLLTTPDKIFISTSDKYYKIILSETKKIPAENIICEPMRRDTALAEGVGAVYIHKKDPDAIICNFASDHLITPLHLFVQQMLFAAKVANETNLFTAIGIVPDRPHTGMGHMKAKKPLSGYTETVLVGEKFVEKPPLDLAEKYTQSGEYFWNAHLFVWKARVFLDLLKKYSPKTYVFLPRLEKSLGTNSERQVLQQTFQMAPTLATDYAVAEKLSKYACIPAKFTWSDVGDWEEVWKHLAHDPNGNTVISGKGHGQYVSVNSTNNLVIINKPLISSAELHDMIIIDTPDALMICPKKDSQSVKKIVQALKDQQLEKYL